MDIVIRSTSFFCRYASLWVFLLLCPYFGKVDKNNEYTITASHAKKLI
jgi:hypothetical protein